MHFPRFAPGFSQQVPTSLSRGGCPGTPHASQAHRAEACADGYLVPRFLVKCLGAAHSGQPVPPSVAYLSAANSERCLVRDKRDFLQPDVYVEAYRHVAIRSVVGCWGVQAGGFAQHATREALGPKSILTYSEATQSAAWVKEKTETREFKCSNGLFAQVGRFSPPGPINNPLFSSQKQVAGGGVHLWETMISSYFLSRASPYRPRTTRVLWKHRSPHGNFASAGACWVL